MEQRFMYYCPNCSYTGSSIKEASIETCPKCGNTLLATGIPKEVWTSKTDEEKATMKSEWAATQASTPTPLQPNSNQSDLSVIRQAVEQTAADIHFIKTVIAVELIIGIVIGLIYAITILG